MALVRISDTSQPTRSDVSDSVFSIEEAGLDPEPGDAIDAATDLVIHSQVTIASYDSRLGPQGGTNVGQAGHIRSGGSLDIHANAQIFGDVRPGSPSWAQAVPVPSGLVSQGNLSLKNKETRTLAAGDYLFDAIDMKNASVLQTQGPVRIWFRSLNMNSSARIEPWGSQPKDMRLYGRVSDGSVDLKAHSSIYGFIYTPAGDVVVRSHARVYGAITGDQVTVHAHAQIHRDVALGDGRPNCIDPPTAPETPFVDRAVIAVAGDVIVRDGGYTDSYDSCLGPHGNGNQGSNGHIQAAGEIQLGYSTAINGQLFPDTPSNAAIVAVPPGLTSAGDLVIQSGNTLYLAAGSYLVNNLTLNSGAKLVGRGGSVRIWYTGSLTVNSHSVLEGQDRMPANLVLYGQGSGRVELKAHGQIFGLVDSPGQFCTVNSHSHLFGAVVAAEAEIKSSGKVHFDEALMHGCQTKRADDPPDGSLPGKPVRSQKGRQQ
jgi:cytoskeletal protein CcmA (bactofilin family)